MDVGPPSNERVHEELSRYVAERYLTAEDPAATISVGPFEVNCFSLCFWVTASSPAGRRDVYVKIPKLVLYDKSRERIMPLSDDERALAEDEYCSLVRLSRDWRSDDIGVRFVKPLGFVKNYNAIVTERFHAEHFFTMFRQFDRQRKAEAARDAVHDALARIGTALARFHRTSMVRSTVDGDAIVLKMRESCSQLMAYGVSPRVIANIVQQIERVRGLNDETECTSTLKGLDVRQVFIDDAGVLFILDPGKTKPGYREVDLARFLVTCRIVYWGSVMLLVRGSPHASYEESFLGAYYGDDARPVKVLRALIVKELLKHWRMAHAVLEMRRWPAALKRILRDTYINPFYERQLRDELAKLGSMT